MTGPVVLLSGGMDSATALAHVADLEPVAIVVDYGQRHHREITAARAVAAHYHAPVITLDLTGYGAALYGNALTDRTVTVPAGHYAADTMKTTVVPNRNAVFIMAAVGIAESIGADRVLTAVHAGDHHIYPDCRPAFILAIDAAARLGTDGKVKVQAPFVEMTKAEIARHGTQLGVPYEMTWSCYAGGELHCGRCGTCTERKEAFHDAGATDPTTYED